MLNIRRMREQNVSTLYTQKPVSVLNTVMGTIMNIMYRFTEPKGFWWGSEQLQVLKIEDYYMTEPYIFRKEHSIFILHYHNLSTHVFSYIP